MRYLVENKIILDDNVITYVIVPKRIKNIYFRFKEDGKLYVSGPSRIQKNIERLLLQNKGNILKLYEKIMTNQNLKKEFIEIKLSEIIPYENNNKIHTDKDV